MGGANAERDLELTSRQSDAIAGMCCRLPLALALTILGGCQSATVFQSNFNSTPVGQRPASAQATGTASVFGATGSVGVVGSPVQAGGEHWLKVSRASNGAPISGMLGTLASQPGGQYNFLCAMFIPTGSGLATLSFEPVPQPQPGGMVDFLHIDFMQDNRVRINDLRATEFGSFPRDQAFDVAVTLNTTASPPTAHIALIGPGASGSVDYTITAPAFFAQQFGAVRVWMGYPWTGHFDSADLLVTHPLH